MEVLSPVRDDSTVTSQMVSDLGRLYMITLFRRALSHVHPVVQQTLLSLIAVGTHGLMVWFHGLSASLPPKKIASLCFMLHTLLGNKQSNSRFELR